jgi:hypothetical protein
VLKTFLLPSTVLDPSVVYIDNLTNFSTLVVVVKYIKILNYIFSVKLLGVVLVVVLVLLRLRW